MSIEIMLALGLLATAWGLDEYLPGRTRVPAKLILGVVLLVIVLVSRFGVLR